VDGRREHDFANRLRHRTRQAYANEVQYESAIVYDLAVHNSGKRRRHENSARIREGAKI